MTHDDAGPIYGPAKRALGQQRFNELVERMAHLEAMIRFALISVTMTAGRSRWTDDELDAIVTDARDVAASAIAFRNFLIELSDHWRAQRQELEP